MERKWDFPVRGERGHILTRSLFIETAGPEDTPVFTLKAEDHNGLPSLKKIYLSYDDPTEYEFAIEVFGEWRIWQQISENVAIAPAVGEWREELEVRVRSRAITALCKQAEQGSSAAARWVAEGGWRPKKRGAPSKAEVERERKIAAGIETSLKDDYNRLFSGTVN